MGYDTNFSGRIHIQPPLNADEITYLNRFSHTRHMTRKQGPYYVDDSYGHNESGVDSRKGHHNVPPAGQPSLWCNFYTNIKGTIIIWNGSEKTREGDQWIRYLIDHFLKPNAIASKNDDPQFKNFTFNHICNGTLVAQGEDMADRWIIEVVDNQVTKKFGIDH